MTSFDASDGELTVTTGVTGRASRMGHRLTIAMTSWQAVVSWADDEPSRVDLTVDVESLQVVRGEGGVTPLSAPEKALARTNALKTLAAQRFPAITFQADAIEKTDEGYRLDGVLTIRGRARPQTIDLGVQHIDGTLQMSCQTQVRQSEFGVKPYSMFMGAMKVADEVTVTFAASCAKDVSHQPL